MKKKDFSDILEWAILILVFFEVIQHDYANAAFFMTVAIYMRMK